MSLDDRFSGWLDGELQPAEIEELQAQLDGDAELAAEFESLRAVRAVLRSESMVVMRPGSIDEIVASVAADRPADEPSAPTGGMAPVVPLTARRRVPTFAAVAASFAIIVSVVGGLGGSHTLPAVGELIARHDAAAAESGQGPGVVDDMPSMASGAEMVSSNVEGDFVHALYFVDTGSFVSLFRQHGELDMDGLVDEMGGGAKDVVAGQETWSKDVGDRHITVLDGDGYVWVFVSPTASAMEPMMEDMMADLPSRSIGIGERLRDVAETAVAPFSFGL